MYTNIKSPGHYALNTSQFCQVYLDKVWKKNEVWKLLINHKQQKEYNNTALKIFLAAYTEKVKRMIKTAKKIVSSTNTELSLKILT